MTSRPGTSAAMSALTSTDVHPGGKTRQVLRVTADRAHHQREAASLRVEYPLEAIGARRVFQLRGHAALDVFDLYQTQSAQRAVLHERADMARHRVRGVAMGDAEHAVAGPHAPREILRFGERDGDRLVANHVEARIERGGRRGVVRVVRRHDRDRVDGVAARALGGAQFRDAVVSAIGRDAELPALVARTRGVRRKDPGDDAEHAVEFRGSAMH